MHRKAWHKVLTHWASRHQEQEAYTISVEVSFPSHPSNEWTPSYQLGKEGPTPSPRARWLAIATLPWMDRIDWSIVLLKFNELEMTRIAIGLRLWLRRAIKRINDRLP